MLKRITKKKTVKKAAAFLLSLLLVLSNAAALQAAEQSLPGVENYAAGAGGSQGTVISGGDSQVVSGGNQQTETEGDNQTGQEDGQKADLGETQQGSADGTAIEQKKADSYAASGTYVLNISDLPDTAASPDNVGNPLTGGTDNYFSLLLGSKSRIEANSKTFADGFAGSKRLNTQGKATVEGCSVKFTTAAPAMVKVYWAAGDAGRQMILLDTAGNQAAVTAEASEKNGLYISELELPEAGTYYLGGDTNSNYIFRAEVTETVVVTETEYELNISELPDTPASPDNVGNPMTGGTDNYFSVLLGNKSRIEANSKTFADGFAGSKRLNTQGKATVEGCSVKFTTAAPATVKVYWAAGDAGRQMILLDTAGNQAAVTAEASEKNGLYISELELAEAGTYYLGGDTNSNYVFRAVVTEEGSGSVEKPERADWAQVAAPVITGIEVKEETIEVTVDMEVGYDGADKVQVTMTDAAGATTGTASASAYKSTHVLTFTPAASGLYSFTASASRTGEEDKTSAQITAGSNFVLPLKAPVISSITGVGGGDMKVKWGAVAEADSYIVTVDGTAFSVSVNQTEAVVSGLTVGLSYTFKVVAVRAGEQSPAGSAQATVSAGVQQEWSFSAFGQSVSLGTKANGYRGSANDGSVTVYSLGGKGKLVPAATDGLAFYYTAIPADRNFVLTAKASVNQWTYSNAQEGFGLMAADAVGTNGDSSAFWNNSYMAYAGKVEYFWDDGSRQVSDSGEKITMKIGIGSQEKVGVTAENRTELSGPDSADAIAKYFKTSARTLETSCAALGSGTYNIIGNFTNSTGVAGTQNHTLTEMIFTIRKNNTGYFVSYTDADGKTVTNKYYDTEALNQIDKDYVYAGFFASRNAEVTFTDISLQIIDPAQDDPAEERPVTVVTPSYQVISAENANQPDYELVFVSNADGRLSVSRADNTVIADGMELKAGVKASFDTVLAKGSNDFEITFTPDAGYKPDEYSVMGSYDTVKFTHSVKYITYGQAGEAIYAAPEGTPAGTGTKQNPLDIYTAVKYVQAGQTIVLKGGTYSLSSTVKAERGVDGTAGQMIYMVADPESGTRPVFDFNGMCAGMIFAGDYWYCKGFDVTNSANGQKGIQISGSYCVFDDLHAYHNGNTGIQVSRYLSSDKKEDWPSYDLILNCTSYGNADIGYEDADGFAAKLTVGEGIVFDGCIAHHNADDGWDLFAKPETGAIGRVIIKNSVAYANGYLEDGTVAGNGNGFKMGGSSISGHHQLINSIAFDNKSKGIDSNSCPDIEIYNCTSFNNGSLTSEGKGTGGNVALYTKDVANTDFNVQGVLSYRTKLLQIGENLSGTGTQDAGKIYGTANYYWDTGSGTSKNKEGNIVSADWFTSMTFNGLSRNADGTINMNGFLELTAKAPEGAGAVMTGTASGSIVIPGETGGNVDDGSRGEETGSGNESGAGNQNQNQNNNTDSNHNNTPGDKTGNPDVGKDRGSQKESGAAAGNRRNTVKNPAAGNRKESGAAGNGSGGAQDGTQNGTLDSAQAGNRDKDVSDNEALKASGSLSDSADSVTIQDEETPLNGGIKEKPFPAGFLVLAAVIAAGVIGTGAVIFIKKRKED